MQVTVRQPSSCSSSSLCSLHQSMLLRRPTVRQSTHVESDPPSVSLWQTHLTSDPPSTQSDLPSTQSDLVTSPLIHTPPTHPLQKPIHPQSFPQSLNLSLFDLCCCCCCCCCCGGGVGGGVLVVFLLCGGGFVWIVVDFFGWWWILWYKICLEVEKMWKICRKIAFSECYQTLEIVFQIIFHCTAKRLDFNSLIGIHFALGIQFT